MPTLMERALADIKTAIEKAGGHKQLAQAIGVKTETVRSWIQPSIPTLRHVAKVETFLDDKDYNERDRNSEANNGLPKTVRVRRVENAVRGSKTFWKSDEAKPPEGIPRPVRYFEE